MINIMFLNHYSKNNLIFIFRELITVLMYLPSPAVSHKSRFFSFSVLVPDRMRSKVSKGIRRKLLKKRKLVKKFESLPNQEWDELDTCYLEWGYHDQKFAMPNGTEYMPQFLGSLIAPKNPNAKTNDKKYCQTARRKKNNDWTTST